MSNLSAPVLIDRARKLLDATPVDEQGLYDVLRALIDHHGYKKAALARTLGIGKQQIFRILASRRDDCAPYRAMCGDRASVLEALHGMPVALQEQLRQQFERTGKTYSQAALRQIKRQLAAGENIVIADAMIDTPVPASARRSRHRQYGNAGGTAGYNDEQAWLRSLVAPVARAEQELLSSLGEIMPSASTAGKQPPPPGPTRERAPQRVIELTPAQTRRLIRQLGGNANLPVGELQAELVRLIRR